MIDATAIIPTTGQRPALLRRALASVHAQTLALRAVLVVVDGDDVQASEVRDQLDGLAAEVIAVGTRRGAGAARNHGARHARTRHLCFLDDDDVWKPDYLAAVFAAGPDFDLALTAFEKHTVAGARPEKVPPVALCADAFLVKNPGLRGSNLVLTRSLYWAAGGFSEALPALNDMDFGLRLVAAEVGRYRRVLDPLVEYHAHDGERLSGRGARAIPPGLSGFLLRHGSRMDHRQEAAFRARALALWGVDPWALAALAQRFDEARAQGTLAAHFPGLLHAAETALLEAACQSDAQADAYQAFIDRLCHAFEDVADSAQRVRALRVVVITTDTPDSVAGLLSSLVQTLTRSRWRHAHTGPLVEILLVRNDADAEIAAAHDAVLRGWDDPRVVVSEKNVPAAARPLSLTEARIQAFRAAQASGWCPSPEAPVWFLDEDFRFEVLVPSVERWYRQVPGGSPLHRLECLALRLGADGVDALVCGNSGAPPVPALGTIGRQLGDLLPLPADAQPSRRDVLAALLERADPYYDLSRDLRDDLRAPVASTWWRNLGPLRWDEVGTRLLGGLPVTRPALPSLHEQPASAWGHQTPAAVAGGNTVLLSMRVLRPERFAQVEWRGVRSRRGDTVWCLRCRREGARIVCASLPLLHARVPRRGPSGFDRALRDALSDALGVGLYESIAAGEGLDVSAIERRAAHRLAALTDNLASAADALRNTEETMVAAPLRALEGDLRALCESLRDVKIVGVHVVEERIADLEGFLTASV